MFRSALNRSSSDQGELEAASAGSGPSRGFRRRPDPWLRIANPRFLLAGLAAIPVTLLARLASVGLTAGVLAFFRERVPGTVLVLTWVGCEVRWQSGWRSPCLTGSP